MALLGLASVFGFSGYLLPMDELSYFATKVGLEIPAAIPFIGPTIANMLRGGPDVSELRCSASLLFTSLCFPHCFCRCSVFICGWCKSTETPRLPARRPNR